MTCACCKGRSQVVTQESSGPLTHGRMTVTARFYWVRDTGWSWCPEQITRIVLHAYGADLDITHLVAQGKAGDYDLIDTDLWRDIETILEQARYGLDEPNIRMEMTLDRFMQEAK